MAHSPSDDRTVAVDQLDFSRLFPPANPRHPDQSLSVRNAMFLVAAVCQAAGMNITTDMFLRYQHTVRVRTVNPEPGESHWTHELITIGESDLLMMFEELRGLAQHPEYPVPFLFTEILGTHGYSVVVPPPPLSHPARSSPPDLFEASA